MKMMQVFGVVVALHLVAILSVIALPGCRSGGAAKSAAADNPAVASDNPLIPDVAASAAPDPIGTTGAPVRFAPSRPSGGQSSVAATPLTPVDLSAAPLTPAELPPVAPVAESPHEPSTPASTYEVQKGDSLWTIARKHGISVGELALANNLSDKATLRIGQKLIVPSRAATSAGTRATTTATAAAASPAGGGSYTVVSGDTLGGIARKHGVKLSDLRAANKLKGDNLRVGQVLTLPAPSATPAAAGAKPAAAASSTVHTVVAGDTLGGIARQYRVTVGEIATANNITDPTKLRVGQQLRIPGARPAPTVADTPAPAPAEPAPFTPAPVTLTPDDALFHPGAASQPPVELTPAPVQLVPVDGDF